jgi:hypothetical protein
VIPHRNKCSWCDHHFETPTAPEVPFELERAFEMTTLFHAYPHDPDTKATA